MVAWTKYYIKPDEEVLKKHTPNAFLLRYKSKGKIVELSGPTLADMTKKAEELSMKVDEVWMAELCDTGSETLTGMVHRFEKGKETNQHHSFWNKLTPAGSAPAAAKPEGKTKKGKVATPAPKDETPVEKIKTVDSVDTQEKETKMVKATKKATKVEPKKEVVKKGKETNATAKGDAAKAKRPAKISGKLEAIDIPKDKPVGKKEAEALFTALQVRENTVRWNAARYLADNMGVAVPAEVLIKKTYGKEGGTTASVGRVVDGIMANAERNKVKIIVTGFKRDGKFHYRMEKA